jgi:N-acetylglucosaminyl-diphospho-decaprenol L-rhamnosyltransferase
MAPSLDIIIVNWNSGEHLRRCLESIRSASRDGFELLRVMVVDNASSDGSADQQTKDIPLTIIHNEINRGFAAACNQGARNSRASYLLFLNPDVVLTDRSLSPAVRLMESEENSKVAVCGVQLVNDKGQIAPSCSRFPAPRHFFVKMFGLNRFFPRRFHESLMHDWNHCESRPVDIVMGAFLLVRQQLFAMLNGFDEDFFVYYEEVDFLSKVCSAGWQSYYLATAQAFHKGGGCSDQARSARLFYSLRSRIIYCRKRFDWMSAAGVVLATLLIEPFSRICCAAAHVRTGEIDDTLKAYAMLLKWWAMSTFKSGRPIHGEWNSKPTTRTRIIPKRREWIEGLAPDTSDPKVPAENSN